MCLDVFLRHPYSLNCSLSKMGHGDILSVGIIIILPNLSKCLFLFFLQYGRILDIELKIPPRPPCYCFVEVFIASIYSLPLPRINF